MFLPKSRTILLDQKRRMAKSVKVYFMPTSYSSIKKSDSTKVSTYIKVEDRVNNQINSKRLVKSIGNNSF